MSETRACPRCAAELPSDAPEGLCPKCLLGGGLQSSGVTGVPAASRSPETPTTPYRSGFTAPAPAELARLFPQLEILELLGQGGMGAVYKARQPGLDRLVALKILPPEAGDAAFAERFTREARSLARLNHPNIVTVYDFGRTASALGSDGLYYFLMEFVDGLNLRQLLHDGKLKPAEALKIVPQLCEALQFAHDEGIVHRDIKPENILLDRKGRVKIADFGLAKLLGGEPMDHKLTATHQVMGTPHYMAPEQIDKPLTVDHRADIYSLGVVFYEMLTGELPLGRFVPPSQRVQVDVRLDEVVLRALEREPERRFQNVSEVKTEVESICGVAAPNAGTSSMSRERWFRWKTLAIILGIYALSFFQPAFYYRSKWDGASGKGEAYANTIHKGWQCFHDAWSMDYTCWYANPLFWISLVFFACRSWLWSSTLAILAAAVALAAWDPFSLSTYHRGYWLWLGSMALLAASSLYAWRTQRIPVAVGPGNAKNDMATLPATPSRPRIVPLIGILNILTGLFLMLVIVWAALPDDPDDPFEQRWQAIAQTIPGHELMTRLEAPNAVLQYLAAAGLFTSGVGLLLWKPWGRTLAIGVSIYSLFDMMINIPNLIVALVIISRLEDQEAASGADELAPWLFPVFVAFIGLVLVFYLAFFVSQLVILCRPRVLAAMTASSSATGPARRLEQAGPSSEQSQGILLFGALALSLLTLVYFVWTGEAIASVLEGTDNALHPFAERWGLGKEKLGIVLKIFGMGGLLFVGTLTTWIFWLDRWAVAAARLAAPGDRARILVRGSSIGLIVMGIFGMTFVLGLFVVLFGKQFFGDAERSTWFWIWPACYAIWMWQCFGVSQGGAQLMALQGSHDDSLAGAWWATCFPPLNFLVWMPVGLWAWIVVNRPEVKAALGKNEPAPSPASGSVV